MHNTVTQQDLEKLTHKQQVMFAVFCAEQVIHLTDLKEAHEALRVTKLWLEGKATEEDCRRAADAAAAGYAAWAAAYAAAAGYAAGYAAYAYAAWAAANAAWAAANAARAAEEDKQKTIQEQRNYYNNLLNLDKYAEELVSD